MSRSDRTTTVMRHLPTTRRALGVVALAALGATAACNDDFLTETPKAIIAADNLYTNVAGFEAGLNGLYFRVRRERFGQDNSVNNLLATAYSIGVDNGYGMYLSPPER